MGLVLLEQAKEQLGLLSNETDTELQEYIESLTAVIERHIGPVEEREFTETIEGRSFSMCLSNIPALSLVSIEPALSDGGALDLSTLVLDPGKGIVYRKGGTFAGTLWSVKYRAGRAEVPHTVQLAALLLLQHLWRTKYGPSKGRGNQDDFDVNEQMYGFGYAVPNRVLHLLEPYKLPPGVA
ncbi:head-tail connector protein [Streptomyces sp. NPDC048209]|uniref:head-tail connector protein n=1 Tax=Streptomyces TaxID=1883 RepID=UPI0034344060